MHHLAQFADIHVIYVRERPGNRCSMVRSVVTVERPYRILHVAGEYMCMAYLLWQLRLHSVQCRQSIPKLSAWGESDGESAPRAAQPLLC
jgi:hypothetical protein